MFDKTKTIIFCDGASKGNPGPAGWGSIISYFDVHGIVRVKELGGFDPQSTNNRMEMLAAIKALEFLFQKGIPPQTVVCIYTDSSYLINGMTAWVFSWLKKGWKNSQGKDIANIDLWQRLLDSRKGYKIKWQHVKGHAGIPGNERADEIASDFAGGLPVDLFAGERAQYGVDLDEVSSPQSYKSSSATNSNSKNGKNSYQSQNSTLADKPYYLSIVDGVLEKHTTWPQCEARVKGRSGVKFKKVKNMTEEREILSKWGI